MEHQAIIANRNEELRRNIALTFMQVPEETMLNKSEEDELEKGGAGSGRKRGFSSGVLKHIDPDDTKVGWMGHKDRNTKGDAQLENYLKDKHNLKDHEVAAYAVSVLGRHAGDHYSTHKNFDNLHGKDTKKIKEHKESVKNGDFGESYYEKSNEDELEKGLFGLGSRGGKIIGTTKSGKAIYDSFGHKKHSKFDHEDHKDAARLHGEKGTEVKASKETKLLHLTEASSHMKEAKRIELANKVKALKVSHPHIFKSNDQIFFEENIAEFSVDLQKAFDSGDLSEVEFEKAVKDLTKLQKKVITNKEGHQQTVYVRVHDNGEEHHFTHGDKVKFEHNGKSLTGHIKGLKSHDKYDKFGTAEIHDEKGNKYSKSLRQIEHHLTPVDDTSTIKGDEEANGGETRDIVDRYNEIKGYGDKEVTHKDALASIRKTHGVKNSEIEAALEKYKAVPIGGNFEDKLPKMTGGDTGIFDYSKIKDYDKWLTAEGIDYAPGDQLKTTSGIRGIPKGSIVQYVSEDRHTGKVKVKLHGFDQTISSKQLNDKTKFHKNGEISQKREESGKFDEFGNLKKKQDGKSMFGPGVKENKQTPEQFTSDIIDTHNYHTKDHVTDPKEIKERDEYITGYMKKKGYTDEQIKEKMKLAQKEEAKPKLSGVAAINTKQKQLTEVEDKIANHQAGINKMDEDELTNAKSKVKLLKKIIQQLTDKVESKQ